jgi:succinate dehydrogenase / fumarate reductase membrane anchor subunit
MMRASRVRPAGNFEATAWFFMRVSGVILILIALFHMLWMHFVVSVETITFATIVERWTGPQGAFWRIFDLMLLVFAFTHGVNGLRQVIDDYIESRGWNAFLQTSIWILWALLLGMGAWIIFTFQPNMPTPFK